MIKLGVARLSLLLAGLAAILLSFALQGGYATDPVDPTLTTPSTLGLFALAGVAAIALSLFRGRRK